jgi:hypothetical protein
LTKLILGGDYPRWNTVSEPTVRGTRFLRELDALSFGTTDPPGRLDFVDEFDLPARTVDEPGCAPDYAVLTPGRLWLIELKTDIGSHRKNQIPSYFDYAKHHHPDLRVDLTYLTPPMDVGEHDVPAGSRLAHVTWDEVMPLVRASWAGESGIVGRTVEALGLALDGIGTRWTGWRGRRLDDPVASGTNLAELTARDGQQRALDHPFGSLEELQQTRKEIGDALGASGSDTRAWVWRADTSGGSPLTEMGERTGYELRLSRYGSTD